MRSTKLEIGNQWVVSVVCLKFKNREQRTENREQRTENKEFIISKQSQFVVGSHFEGAIAIEKSHSISSKFTLRYIASMVAALPVLKHEIRNTKYRNSGQSGKC